MLKAAHDETAVRVSDQDIRRRNAGAPQQGAQVGDAIVDASGAVRRLAPGEPRSVIGADARKRRDPFLHRPPGTREFAGTLFDHHRGTERASTQNVQLAAANRYQPAGRGMCRGVPLSAPGLIQPTGDG